MDLFPNSVSFRVVNTIDVRDESEVPADYTGRVRHVEGDRVVAISWYLRGRLDNPSRRTPAHVRLRHDGQVKQERHYRSGRLHDPEPGKPAVRGYFADGSRRYEEHYRYGRRQDDRFGSAAITKWRKDGSVRSVVRYPNHDVRDW